MLYLPTAYYLIHDFFDSEKGVHHYAPSTHSTSETRVVWNDWSDAFGNIQDWLKIVAREHFEPDLWGIEQSEKKLVASDINDLENTVFDTAEIKRIASSVGEIREFVLKNANLTDRNQKFIIDRLQHLQEASTRLGRKDWLTLAMGTLTNIVVGVALAPDAARELLRTAGVLLGWVAGAVPLIP